MSVILLLIPLSVAIAAAFLAAFIWAVRSGQYEDTCTPSMPHATWGIIPSTADRRGSDGAAGRRGWRSRTNATARSASSCGRLPTVEGSPMGRSTSLMAPPPAVLPRWSLEPPLGFSCT